MNETIIKTIAEELKISVKQVNTVLEMLGNGDTVPFISRYRKEQTGALDEEQILYIEKQYKQREREGKLRFKKVKNEISQCFELYDEAELSQNDIFYKLVDWLKEKTDCDDEVACTAMVAFFVQNCEVFHDEASK